MSVPPGESPGPPQPPSPVSGERTWPWQYPIWWALIAVSVLLIIIGITLNATRSTSASSTIATPSPRPAITPTASTSPLSCDARAVSRRPADHTVVKVQVRTVAHAQVTATGPLALARGEKAVSQASARGTRTLRFRVGDAPPGVAVVITVRVSLDGSNGSCQARLRPRPAPTTAVTAPAQPVAPPSSAPAQPPPALVS
jgi:hypothetical protein